MPRTYRIGFAEVALGGLFSSEKSLYEPALIESWTPGARTTRYGRSWRLSAPRRLSPGVYAGHIGFVREGEVETIEFDETVMDFVREEASGGVIIPFVVSVRREIVAFQLVPGQVRPTSFTGAFEALLRQSSAYDWTVSQLVLRRSYESWRTEVQQVTHFSFRLEPPNPHWYGNEFPREVIDRLRLEVAQVVGNGQDINDADELFRDMLDHVTRDYGRGTVRAVDQDASETEWRSDGGGAVPIVEKLDSEEEEEPPADDLARLIDHVIQYRERFTSRLGESDATTE